MKQFFAKHAKSSAAVISLAIHALILIVAVTFVAVKVITKEDNQFEVKQVSRPKMQLKKLQVPVNMKKSKPKPKLRKRIVAQSKVQRSMPDIKMPEITGVKGGIGGGTGGLGGGASLGFTLPEIELFGVKSKGEKIFIILDSSADMMYDEMGGIPAYTLIKEELGRILGRLPSTTLFNISVFDQWNTQMLFPDMVPANETNVGKIDEWLGPLNSVRPDMGAKDYGTGTIGPGGDRYSDDFRTGRFEGQELWHRSVMLAMKQQADTVFLLTTWWGHQRIMLKNNQEKWFQSAAGQKFNQCYEEALKLHEEENKQRLANGEPPRVLRTENRWVMNHAYFPDIEFPPEHEYYYFTPRDFLESMVEIRGKYKPAGAGMRSGLSGSKSRKVDFSLNVIHFKRQGVEEREFFEGRTYDNFTMLTQLTRGEYRTLAGLKAIQSAVSR